MRTQDQGRIDSAKDALPKHCSVVIVGAGPTGLMAALVLQKHGINFRIIDKAEKAGTESRALGLHARSLEFYRMLGGLDKKILKQGLVAGGFSLWHLQKSLAKLEKKFDVSLGYFGGDLSRYPYMFVIPQDKQEKILEAELKQLGVKVERNSELIKLKVKNLAAQPEVMLEVLHHHGHKPVKETIRADYVIGADGAHSIIRHFLNVGFRGGMYEELFYVADVVANGQMLNKNIHIVLIDGSTDFLATFPIDVKNHQGQIRLLGTMDKVEAKKINDIEWVKKHLEQRVEQWAPIDIKKIRWFSTYRVHHRVASEFRPKAGFGRVFLLGDAAHLHSPAGGQGMNTGLGDAVNIAWKLAMVLKAKAAASILDTYHVERQSFAKKLVGSTDRAFRFIVDDFARGKAFKTIMPWLLPKLTQFAWARRLAFKTLSQIGVHYRMSRLSKNDGISRGYAVAGNRLPYILWDKNHSNFDDLDLVRWQLQIYGDCSMVDKNLLLSYAKSIALPITFFASNNLQKKLLKSARLEPGVYLLRPDGHVAVALKINNIPNNIPNNIHGVIKILNQYQAEWQLQFN